MASMNVMAIHLDDNFCNLFRMKWKKEHKMASMNVMAIHLDDNFCNLFRMKWKKEHKMASMNAMPMHQMHPALAYGHHPHLQVEIQ